MQSQNLLSQVNQAHKPQQIAAFLANSFQSKSIRESHRYHIQGQGGLVVYDTGRVHSYSLNDGGSGFFAAYCFTRTGKFAAYGSEFARLLKEAAAVAGIDASSPSAAIPSEQFDDLPAAPVPETPQPGHKKTSLTLAKCLKDGKPVKYHPYCTKKQIPPSYFTQMYGKILLVPFTDESGQVKTFQRIYDDPDKEKRFLSGIPTKGLTFKIPAQPGASTQILIAEGASTAISLHEATGQAVQAVGGVGQISEIYGRLRRDHSADQVVCCFDNDDAGRSARDLVTCLYPDALWIAPHFKTGNGKDFNDLACSEGVQAVCEQVRYAGLSNVFLPVGQFLTSLPDLMSAIDDPNIIDIAINAPTGTGKTTLAKPILERLRGTGVRVIVCVPTKILSRNKGDDLNGAEGNDFEILYGGQVHQDGCSSVTVYDSIAKIPDEEIVNSIVLIDETHELIKAASYRSPALNLLRQKAASAKKRIYLTGTPIPEFIHSPQVDLSVYIRNGIDFQARVILTNNAKTDLFRMKRKAKERGEVGTYLVFCDRKKVCDAMQIRAEKLGFQAGSVHADNPTDGHHIGLLNGRVSNGMDFLFVTIYPSMGVDIRESNITHVIFTGYCNPIDARQLVGRVRGKMPDVVFFRSATRSQNVRHFPRSYAQWSKVRQSVSEAIDSLMRFDDLQIASGKFTFEIAKVWRIAGYTSDPSIRSVIKVTFEGLRLQENPVDLLLFGLYDNMCKCDPARYDEELRRYGFELNEVIENHTINETPEEKQIRQAADEQQDRLARKRFRTVAPDVVKMSDRELSEAQYSNETPEAHRFKRLTDKLEGDRETAKQIFHVVGTSDRKLAEVCDQVDFKAYLATERKSEEINALYDAFKEGQRLRGQDVSEVMGNVLEQFSERKDPRFYNLTRLPDGRKRVMSDGAAVRLLRSMFMTKRCKMDDGNGKRVNGYVIISLDPLAKYRGVKIPRKWQETLETPPLSVSVSDVGNPPPTEGVDAWWIPS